MMRTHVAGAILLGVLLRPFFPAGHPVLFFGIVIAASFIPDIDHPTSWINNKLKFTKVFTAFVEHRGLFHSGLFGIALGAIAYFGVGGVISAPLVIGFFSHLILDGMTREGINFLHPLSTFHLRGPVITNSVAEVGIFAAILALTLLQVL